MILKVRVINSDGNDETKDCFYESIEEMYACEEFEGNEVKEYWTD